MAKKTAPKVQIWRQGDVMVERVDTIPVGAEIRKRSGRIVLAYGEVTGHAHAVMEACAVEHIMGGTVYIAADGGISLRHEEHGTIELEPGIYKVRRQVEYTPAAIRNVED